MASNSSVLDTQSSVTPSESISAIRIRSGSDTDAPESNALQASSGKKRKRNPSKHIAWSFARKARKGIEPEKEKSGQYWRRVWYCNWAECEQYSTLSTVSAVGHLKSRHGVDIESLQSASTTAPIQQDIRTTVGQQLERKHEEDNVSIQVVLRNAVKTQLVHQALLELIVHRDLPLSMVQWPEFQKLVSTLNYTAPPLIWKSHTETSRKITKTFDKRQLELRSLLQTSRSLIHLTTDTWHSPNRLELQAITAHWVDNNNTLRKALLALPNLEGGHKGIQVAEEVIKALDFYGIKDCLGFITADNHSANNTLCTAISEELTSWSPSERRLRCVGHIINLAVQSFLFARNQDAVKLAIADAEQSQVDIDTQLLQPFNNNDKEAGWIQTAALQKLLQFVNIIRRSDRLFNAFKSIAGKTIRAPNDTRWNSYLFTFEDALELKGSYTTFILEQPALVECELSAADWLVVE
jgi:hypothetical protein